MPKIADNIEYSRLAASDPKVYEGSKEVARRVSFCGEVSAEVCSSFNRLSRAKRPQVSPIGIDGDWCSASRALPFPPSGLDLVRLSCSATTRDVRFCLGRRAVREATWNRKRT